MARGAVWIDLTNSPHVLFFRPILRRLDDAGVPVVVTARDYAQTLGLLELYGIPHTVIGRHGGAGLGGKATGLARRSLALTRFGRATRGIRQAVSHGSNDLAVAARLLHLHSTVLHDFEGATTMHRINFRLVDKVMVPAVIPWPVLASLGLDERRYRPYPGIKEQVTLADFEPDPGVVETLGLDASRPIAVLRPPATMSLYHRGIENTLFDDVLAWLQAERRPGRAAAADPGAGAAIPGRRGCRDPCQAGRRPVAGICGGPRRERRRHDEPGGGPARHAHLDHLRGRAGRRRPDAHRHRQDGHPGSAGAAPDPETRSRVRRPTRPWRIR